MAKVLVIGAGGVSSVCVHKMAMNKDIFSDIHLASRTKSKCDAIAASVKDRTGVEISTYEIDAEEVPAMINLIKKIGPKLVVNLALPYQDLPIMDACLEAVSITSTPRTTSPRTRRSSNITGSGPIRTASRMRALPRCSAPASIRA